MLYVLIILAAEFIRLLIANYIVAYFIIVVHELTHYAVARCYKMDIDQINIGTETGVKYFNIGLHLCGNVNISYYIDVPYDFICWYRQIAIVCIIAPLITIAITLGAAYQNIYFLPLLGLNLFMIRDFKLTYRYWKRYRKMKVWYAKRYQRISRQIPTV